MEISGTDAMSLQPHDKEVARNSAFQSFFVVWIAASIAILLLTEEWPLTDWQIGFRVFVAAIIGLLGAYQVYESVCSALRNRDS